MNLSSSSECSESSSISACSSSKTVAASSNETPCFRRFAASFAESHSNWISATSVVYVRCSVLSTPAKAVEPLAVLRRRNGPRAARLTPSAHAYNAVSCGPASPARS